MALKKAVSGDGEQKEAFGESNRNGHNPFESELSQKKLEGGGKNYTLHTVAGGTRTLGVATNSIRKARILTIEATTTLLANFSN